MSPSCVTIASARALFDEQLTLITSVLRRTGMRRLPHQEVEDFVSWALLRIIEHDYRCLRGYRGDSPLEPFLTVVATRLAIDYFRALRGVWRPSAVARRLGAVGVALDRMLHRDRLGVRSAVAQLRHRHRVVESTDRLRRIAASLPFRASRDHSVPAEDADLRSPARASDRVNLEERLRAVRQVAGVVRQCMAEVTAEERSLLLARFVERRTVASLADELGVPAKVLYRRLERCLERIRRRAFELGLTSDEVHTALSAAGELSAPFLTQGEKPSRLTN